MAWRMCDVGPGPYDASLPFLIQWTTPMAPGPADGPVVEYVTLTPPDPDRVADLLLALGFVPSRHWPRRVFREVRTGSGITLIPVGSRRTRARARGRSWDEPGEPSLALARAVRRAVDPPRWTGSRDRRCRTAAGSGRPRCCRPSTRRSRAVVGTSPTGRPPPGWRVPRSRTSTPGASDPDRYRLLGVRADAWVEVVRGGLGLGEPRRRAAGAAGRATHLRRPVSPSCVAGRHRSRSWWPGADRAADDAFVLVGVGEPADVLERQPDCGCDACDTGSADLLATVDDAFLLALGGGVYVVREGDRVVTRALNGWGATGVFAPGEEQRWLADAAAGRRTGRGVVRGSPGSEDA